MGLFKKGLAIGGLLLAQLVSAQQDLVWFLGPNGVKLQFDGSTANPDVSNNGAPFQVNESISVVSDCDGEVVFYSDGIKVYDGNNQQMPNGGGLLGSQENLANTDAGGSSMNGAIIVSDPASSNKYYVFTVGEVTTQQNNGWRYTEVDMGLQGNAGAQPNGDVTSNKNILVKQGLVTEGMAVTSNACGDSIWVVTHSFNGDTMFALPITAAGGIGSVVSTVIGPDFGVSMASRVNRRGSMDFSPDGSTLAMAYLSPVGGHLMDFDFASGQFSNHRVIADLSQGCHSVEFSFDGEKVFFGRGAFNNIARYNIVTSDYSIVGALATYAGDLERAPNGKIYASRFNGNTIAVIDNPDAADGDDLGYDASAITLSGNTALGLPQMHVKPGNKILTTDITVPFDLTEVCDKGGALDLTAEPNCGTWAGGFFISSAGVFDPSALSAGSYQVSYNLGECYNNDTVEFVVDECCPPLQVRDSVLCEGSDAFNVGMLLDTGLGSWSMTSVPNGSGGLATFVDSVFDASNYLANTTFVTDGEYELTYTFWNAPLPECPDSAVAIIEVDSFPRAIFGLQNASLNEVCGTELDVNAITGLQYDWSGALSDGQNNQTLNADGTYLLTVNSPGENCFTTDSIQVVFDQAPIAGVDVRDTIVCGAGSINVGVNQSGLTNSWSGPNTGTGDSLTITSAGQYTVRILSGANGFCPTLDTIDVQLAPPFEVDFTGVSRDTAFCKFLTALELRAPGGFAEYIWSGPVSDVSGNDDSVAFVRDFNDGDQIIVEVRDAFGCNGFDTVTVSNFCVIPDPNLPNIIVPNGTVNTTLIPLDYPDGTQSIYNALFPKSEFKVLNRWGLEMYTDNDYPNWDGRNKQGLECADGVYYWVLNVTDVNGDQKILNGFVHLVNQ